MSPESSADQDCHALRRRHKSAVQRSVTADVSDCSELSSKNIPISFEARKLAEVAVLLICILEATGSDLGSDGDRLDWSSLWLSSVIRGKSWDNIFKLGHDCFLPRPF
jgi:hypothetical protein